MHKMNKPTVTAFGSCTVFVAKQGTSSLHSAVCKMMNFTFLRVFIVVVTLDTQFSFLFAVLPAVHCERSIRNGQEDKK